MTTMLEAGEPTDKAHHRGKEFSASALLLGEVAASYLRERLADSANREDGDSRAIFEKSIAGSEGSSGQDLGTARFIIDCLSPQQIAAIAQSLLRDTQLRASFEIRLPRAYMAGTALPDAVLTDERATFFRNAPCDKPALLLANTGDDEEQSLRDLTAVGAPDLQARPDLWVAVAAAGLAISDEQRLWWIRALNALQDLRFVNLERFSAYVIRTRTEVLDEGRTIIGALGAALPALGLPRDTEYFENVPSRTRTHVSKWRSMFSSCYTKRACYLSKLLPNGNVLSQDELQVAYEKVKENIPDRDHPYVEAFILAPGGWTAASSRLSEREWGHVKWLFTGLGREKFNLGQETLAFYGERDPELITATEQEYLRGLASRRNTHAEFDDDKQFYGRHRVELREDRKLRIAWERFLFGKPKETHDFLAGLAASLEALLWDPRASTRTLTIRCDLRFKKDLRNLNMEAGIYFARRYNGLKALLGRSVSWDVGDLFDFPSIVEGWKAEPKPRLNTSEAKSALQLKFVLEVNSQLVDGSEESSSTQFIWKFNPLWISSEFANDWTRLAENPFVRSAVDVESTSSKGSAQSVDLRNVRTLMAAAGHARGSLIATYKRSNDLAIIWRSNLKSAIDKGWIADRAAKLLGEKFEKFEAEYLSAIRGFMVDGVASRSLDAQLTAYGELLTSLSEEARGDRSRLLLLRPILQLGVSSIEGSRPAAIAAPWHPLKLGAISRKARKVVDLIRLLTRSNYVDFGDSRVFFRDIADDLAHVYYPEVVVGWVGDKPELLATADVVGDYSLLECPIASDSGADDTNENPAEGASRVTELAQRYIALQPHEEANLSVVLFNSDSSQLPMAVVERLAAINQDKEDARCEILLRHRDARKLRALYEHIVESSGDEIDAVVPSETSRDFMARLRIGIMPEQAPVADVRDGSPKDIVFSQDVIARHARLDWYPVGARPASVDLSPAQWSRRRPASTGDMKSVVYLVCPEQRAEGWSYLTALASFFRGDWDRSTTTRLAPARQLDFQDPTTSKILEETHNLAAWVANYDELLDRRQLVEQGVRVIRYQQTNTQGRNLVVSSRAPLGLLKSMVSGRLRGLSLGKSDSEVSALADRFIADANNLSGDIVLRAARRGKSASELIGLVLSQYLLRHELGLDNYAGWYFLDDYADWLGQREQQIADLMGLCAMPNSDGAKHLVVVVSEAKYIDFGSLSEKRKESQKQLRDTLRRLASAVLRDVAANALQDHGASTHVGRLDRNVWLARLSDMLVDGVRFPIGHELDLPEWRRAIRDGSCNIELRGYSHVFVSGPPEAPDESESVQLSTETDDLLAESFQEVFSRSHVRALILAYATDSDPTTIRRDAAGDGWASSAARRPHVPPSILNVKSSQSTARVSAPRDEQATTTDSQTMGAPQERDTVPRVKDSTVDSVHSGASTHDNNGPPPVQSTWAYEAVSRWLGGADERFQETPENIDWLRKTEAATRSALQQFQLQSKLLSGTLTPNAALLKFQGSSQLTVDQVLKRRSEFLTTHGLNMIGVQPEAGVIAISIARPRRETVSLRALWKRWRPNSDGGNQDLLIGVREEDGELLILSPGNRHAPHTLIAGSTGSGKSVLMQNIILSIAATNLPAEARIILIDPKQGVDYFAFEKLPHIEGGIIDRQEDALASINALVDEMDARYSKLRQARVSNLHAYNARASIDQRIPAIWLIHDEFAEWMLADDYKNQVTSVVSRLGVKARAAGIYLVFAAQRPEASVMPMQLRANLGNRLILRVDSEGTSEIALGEKGAERLLGRGHLLARLEGEAALIYAQVPFATPEEIDALVVSIESQPTELPKKSTQLPPTEESDSEEPARPDTVTSDGHRVQDDDQSTDDSARVDSDREELIFRIRQYFSDGVDREREEAITGIARELGYKRTGVRIAEELDNAIRAAVRRGILENDALTLRLATRSVTDYQREFLKEQFLASLNGRHWVDRDDAIRAFARWLGFRRTGVAIDEEARSVIKGLLREKRLESDGDSIRRSD